MDDLKGQIRQFIITEVAPDLGLQNIEDDEPLIESGIVDSLGILRILSFVEEAFGVDLSSDEIRPENFRDLRTICAMVEEQAKT